MDGVGNLMIQLSQRLQTVAQYITKGHRMADIGSDHAMLPVYLVQHHICSFAIAGEINEGPWQAASKQIANANLSDAIVARRGNGLEVIAPHEVDTITICGMGGALISTILEQGYAQGKLEGVKELVLQPNIGEDAVRAWLLKHNWALQDESILEEDGKIYEVLYAKKIDGAKEWNEQLYNDNQLALPYAEPIRKALALRIGPYLLKKRDDVLRKKWLAESDKLDYIISSLSQSDLNSAKAKLASVKQDQQLIKEVLEWLYTDKR